MKKVILFLLLTIAAIANEYVLAIQWFPSVCKVKNYKECQRPLPFWRSNFTLHGLWPKKKYCNVSAREKILDKKREWQKIPLKISPYLSELIATYMPGYISGLHKHEWVKHGSCYSKSPEKYFLDAISLVSQLNTSKVKEFFLKNRGKRVQTLKIRKVFDKEFGEGSGKKVKFICKNGYLTELRINLKGKIVPNTSIYDLLQNSKKSSIGCKIGLIAR
ncbi:ribonuclease T2 family protein [Nitrosophilus labii]|uniref:ribonuclease T2 family protein n=1 Tax=Nitrosophilus labii TaxID=2706014 RepID=UPI001656A92F|nr:hypothetical protein [Nitrosophilus labii]